MRAELLGSHDSRKFGLHVGGAKGKASHKKKKNRVSQPQALEVRQCMAGDGLALGINLSKVDASNREWVFVDAFKHHTPWVSQNPGAAAPWNRGDAVEVDANGNPLLRPGQAAGTLMLRNVEGHYPSGRYVITYDGDGDISLGMDARVVSRAGHRIEADVTATDNGIYLRIDRSNRADPVRNVHVWMPGFENAASPFHPLFLQRLQAFSTLRFMDWQRTNNSTLVHWSDRTLTTDSSQFTDNGVALEYMIDLANTLGKNVWFDMPHLADDEFVRNFAQMVKDRLNPGLKVYVEYSNEVWNSNFDQAEWASQEALARFGDINKFTWVIADEAKRDWDIWRNVYGADAGRVVRVVAGQLGRPGVTEAVTDRLNGGFDAVAPAAYFSNRSLVPDANTTARDLLRNASGYIDTGLLPNLAKHKQIADGWSTRLGRHVEFVTYEGGQHFTAQNRTVPWQQALYDAQVDTQMYEAYRKLLLGVKGLGLEMFTAFNYVGADSKSGSWGHLQYQDQPAAQAPKWRALMDAQAGNFQVDVTGPAASLARRVSIDRGATSTQIVVTYTDNYQVDRATLDANDLVVIGPTGQRMQVTLESTSVAVNHGVIDVTYRLAAPGGTWDPTDNGHYTVQLVAGQVLDVSGNPAAAATLGAFDVYQTQRRNSAFVASIYNDIFGRQASAQETDFWLDRLDAGGTTGDVSAAFLNSREYRANAIGQLYHDYLGREADESGLDYWIGVWNRGGGKEMVQAGIISSIEYREFSGGTDSDWVSALYQNLLGRAALRSEINYWSRAAAAGKQREVVLGFVTSDEYRANLVREWYFDYLGRAPENHNDQVWARFMRKGMTQQDVQLRLLSSQEYRARRDTNAAV